MYVAFWYQHDVLNQETKCRSHVIGETLRCKDHSVVYIDDDVIISGPDILVIDHMDPPKSVAERAVKAGMKIMVIDGKDPLADVSVSAFANDEANYSGVEYIMFPQLKHETKYNVSKKNSSVFVGVGPSGKNNYVDIVLKVLDKMKINAIVAKGANRTDLRRRFSRIEVFAGDNYYDAMHECVIAITGGDSMLFQALHYGIPTIALAQYDHQNTNIQAIEHCCVNTYPDEKNIETSIAILMNSEYYRRHLSDFAKHHVDGKGVERICNVIEGLK